MINQLLNHVETCKQYSIDTESERTNNQLSLIQINSIPIEPPSIVMLFELKHLPDQHSQKYEKILEVFQLIFRSGNEIYSWGNTQKELEPAKELFIWPLPAALLDIQPHFSAWYDWARTQCGVRGLSHPNDMDNDNGITQQHHQQSSCYCHPPSPYRINELWSLQNAFKYGCNLFIDKSCTLSHWSLSLSSSNSPLSHANRMKMIHYATHDAMAVTFLIRPITEKWTFDDIKNRKMNEMFVAFKSTKLPPLPTSTTKKKKIKNINLNKFSKLLAHNEADLEPISSDEEIYLNQLIKPNDLKIKQDDIIDNDDGISLLQDPIESIQQQELNDKQELNVKQDLNNEQQLNDIELIINEENQLGEHHDNEEIKTNEGLQENPSKRRNRPHRERTQASRQRKNKKRNVQRRKYRYRQSIIRPVYDRFPKYLIRKILRLHNINFTHVKINEENDLVIGLTKRTSKQEAEHNLATNIFSKQSYLYYRKLYRR